MTDASIELSRVVAKQSIAAARVPVDAVWSLQPRRRIDIFQLSLHLTVLLRLVPVTA